MKKLALVALAASFAVACNNAPKGEKAEATEAQEVEQVAEAVSYAANTSASIIEWMGSKPTGDQHNGTIGIKEGSFEVKEGALVGGSFIIDMNSIVNLDIPADNEYNAKLVGHLKHSDFFEVETYPTARFEITNVEAIEDTLTSHRITGNLTMKDVSKSISFNAAVSMNEESIQFKAPQFVIDRTEWNVKFNSGKFFSDLKDKLINDDIALKIQVEANAS